MDIFGIKLSPLRLSLAFRIIALYEESGSMSMGQIARQRLRFTKGINKKRAIIDFGPRSEPRVL
jgi:hypothetical protein